MRAEITHQSKSVSVLNYLLLAVDGINALIISFMIYFQTSSLCKDNSHKMEYRLKILVMKLEKSFHMLIDNSTKFALPRSSRLTSSIYRHK